MGKTLAYFKYLYGSLKTMLFCQCLISAKELQSGTGCKKQECKHSSGFESVLVETARTTIKYLLNKSLI